MESYTYEPEQKAKSCIIWMHGLGADYSDMASLASQIITGSPIRHIFLNAPLRAVTINNGMTMRAWYDIFDFGLTRREDKDGIITSQTYIREAIGQQIQNGMDSTRICLAGFSQGGAMALYTALNTSFSLGGVIVLSGYLPLASEFTPILAKNTPIFFGYGSQDQTVLPVWSKMSIEFLMHNGYNNISCYDYPMGHSICAEEIDHLTSWLTKWL